MDVLPVLIGRKHLLEDIAQLVFAPRAAYLHVGEHVFQIAYVHRQGVHLAQTLVDGFQLVGYPFERFGEAFFEGALQFFIHREPHPFELFFVVLADALEFGFEGKGVFFQRAGYSFVLFLEKERHLVHPFAERLDEHLEVLARTRVLARHIVLEFGLKTGKRPGRFIPRRAVFLAYRPLYPFGILPERNRTLPQHPHHQDYQQHDSHPKQNLYHLFSIPVYMFSLSFTPTLIHPIAGQKKRPLPRAFSARGRCHRFPPAGGPDANRPARTVV